MRQKLLFLLTLLIVSLNGYAQTFTNIDLHNPSLQSGTAKQPGAVYKYSNAAGGNSNFIDAYIQIVKTSNVNTSGSSTATDAVGLYAFDNPASVNNPGGFDDNFQPVTSCSQSNSSGLWTSGGGCSQGSVKMSYRSNQNYLVHFRIYFKKAGTAIDTALNLKAAFIDIDGFGGGTEAEQNAFMPGISYAVAGNTTLNFTVRPDGLINAEGDPANVGGIQFTTITAITQATYLNRTFVDFAIGMNTNSGNLTGGCYSAVAGGRLASVSFGAQPSGCTTIVSTSVYISGTIWDDADGSANNTFTNIRTNSEPGTNGGGLYVYAIDSTTGTIVGKSSVASNGTWTINDIPNNIAIKLLLSKENVAVGVTNGGPGGVLNTNWVATSPLMRPAFRPTANTTNLDFGIEQIPTGNSTTTTRQLNPGGAVKVPVPCSAFTGSDPEDGTYAAGLSGKKISLSVATNGTLYYNNVAITATTVINNFNCSLVTIDPAGTTPVAITPTFDYTVYDAAGKSSTPKTISLPFEPPIAISGNVFDDANGDAIKATSEAFTNAGGLNAVLTTSGGVVMQVVAVNGTTGAYQFDQSISNSNYMVVITTANPAIGSSLTSSTLPSPANGEWVNTGVNLSGTANTSNKTGVIAVTVGTVAVTNQNFGIEQIPTGYPYTTTRQLNPGGTVRVPVPSAAFTGTDPEDGTYTAGLSGKKVTLYPATNGTLYYNNTAVTSATTVSSFNPSLAQIDPSGTTQVTITPTFNYSVFDAADQSSIQKTISVPFEAPLAISGNVFDDANGDAIKATTEAFTNAGGLNAVLTTSGGVVMQVVAVNGTTGAYQFDQSISNSNYVVVITTANPAIGSSLTSSTLPSPANGEWVNTGVNLSGTANTSNKTGVIAVTVGTVAVTNQNFGIEQIPTGYVYTTPRQLNPGGTIRVQLPSAAFTGTDPEDGTYTAGLSGKIVTLYPATNGTLYYNNSAVSSAITITSFNPSLVQIDPTGTTQVNITPTYNYSVFDAANQSSIQKTISVPFEAPLAISGNVFDDANGDAIKATTEAFTNAGGLNAVLTTSGGVVMQVVAVNGTTGAYQFDQSISNSNYVVVITTANPAIGSSLTSSTLPSPANGAWVHTGVNLSGTANTSNKTGVIAVTVGTVAVTNQNFGIEQIPTGNNYTSSPGVLNPGGNTQVPVPNAAFTGSDPEDGTYTTGLSGKTVILYPAANGTLYYNNVPVTTATTITGFNPSLVTIDPAGTTQVAVTPTFNYSVFDAANQSSVPKTITITVLPSLLISGNVFDDANGDAVKDPTESFTNAGGLNAVLTTLSGTVIQVAAVNATTGAYQLDQSTSGNTYKVILTTANPAIGSTLTISTLPSPANGAWVNTGVNQSGGANTSNKTGVMTVLVTTAAVPNQNFGIEQIPTGYNYTAPGQFNPGGTVKVSVPNAAFTGTDPEDGTYTPGLSGKTVTLTPGTNGNLYYNNVLVTATQTITAFDPTKVSVDPTGSNPTGFVAVTSTFSYSVVDAAGQPSVLKTITLPFDAALCINVRVYLEGALANNGGATATGGRPLMRDDLRNSPFTSTNYIPTQDPYTTPATYVNVTGSYTKLAPQSTNPQFQQVSSASVFTVTGQNAIVDWVFVELRSKSNSATVLATRSGLIQRDGDVVDVDGTSCLSFPGVAIDSYFVAIRHRSHLGTMTKYGQSAANLQTLVDFTVTGTPLYDKGTVGTNNFAGLSQKDNVVGTYRAMWQGDFDANRKVKYAAPGSDNNILLGEVLDYPTNTGLATGFDFAYGYFQGDYNMNSKAKFAAPVDDQNLLLGQVLDYPLNTFFVTGYDFLIEQLP